MRATKKKRKEDNEAFLAKKSEDEGVIELLETAKKALSKHYKDNICSVVFGVKQGQDFKSSEDAISKNMFIEDLEDDIKNGIKHGANTQEEFEADMKAAETLEEEFIEKRVNLINTITRREEEKTDEHKSCP